ncbi:MULTISPECIES: UPF0223 family protein [Bacillaceae]|uniref:UPF0223 protein AWH48_10175 n=1 Tax=Domibacillus aminovorans TaxID=29332 RepID=A0A177KJT5_9BACI|nr:MULTISPECIES: UPF0223 family protein [Bacillaceae]OAH53643.1 hypothetical protein AWH48_10175 [Domibacillus aminovorans]
MEYSYPFRADWSTEEVIDVVSFFEAVENVYEKGMNREEFMDRYRRFKAIVPGKADEKRICDEFEEVSNYSSYHAVQKMKQAPENARVRM